LGGWSMGGLVAYEMARRLAARDQRVERLVLIDSRTPAADRDGVAEVDETTLALLFARDLGDLFGVSLMVSSEELQELETAEEVLGFLYEKMQAARIVPSDLELSQIVRLFAMFRTNHQAMMRYSASSYAGRLVLLKANELLAKEPQAPDLGWGELAAGGVEIHGIPGNHYSMLREPHVPVLADRLRKILDPA
ncbi:MAG: non-ribosomal peptide synthetase, partial [bacterium]|nr:non-ribosomal peptide synthetase [bacterium]